MGIRFRRRTAVLEGIVIMLQIGAKETYCWSIPYNSHYGHTKIRIVIKRLAVLFLLRLWFPGSNKSLYLAKEIFLYQNIYVNLTLRWVLFLILLILAVIAVKENCMNTKLRSSFGTRTAMKFVSKKKKNLNSLVVI